MAGFLAKFARARTELSSIVGVSSYSDRVNCTFVNEKYIIFKEFIRENWQVFCLIYSIKEKLIHQNWQVFLPAAKQAGL